MKIAIIGKGRVATHLTQALASAGHDIVMCGGRKRIQAVPADTEVVILSIKDDSQGGIGICLQQRSNSAHIGQRIH